MEIKRIITKPIRRNAKPPRFVEWRKTLWLKYPIPEDLREHYPISTKARKRGAKARFKRFFRCDLRTCDIAAAKRLSRANILKLERDFKVKRRAQLRLISEAEHWRKQLVAEPPSALGSPAETLSPEELANIEYEPSARDLLVDWALDLNHSVGHARAMMFFKRATGQGVLMEDVLGRWLAASSRAQTTKARYKRIVGALVTWCRKHRISPKMVEIDSRRARRFLEERAFGQRGSRTVANERSILISFWDWYLTRAKSSLHRKIADVEPWKGGHGDNPWRII